MNFRDGKRAQSIQIGAILLFGILVTFAAGYQAFVVPNQNAAAEQDHSELVQGQMENVRTGIHVTSSTGTSTPASIRLGVDYPQRAIFLNPAPGAATLETGAPSNVVIENAVAIDSETADFWNGTARGTSGTYETRSLRYRPAYKIQTDPPTTVYESTVLYDQFEGTSLTQSSQQIVQGRDINLVSLQGEYRESGTGIITVEPDPRSAPTRTIAIRGESGQDIELTVPISDGDVGAELAGDIDTNPDADATYDDATDELRITLDGSKIYRLRLSSVGLGTGTTSPSAAYVTDIAGDNATIPESSRQRVAVEVRDVFNGPVAGEQVAFEATSAGTFRRSGSNTATVTTDEEGQATVIYNAPDDVGDSDQEIDVTATINSGTSDFERVDATIFVFDTGGG